ncbi:MAG TPA: hypothetical protein DEB30_02005 [Candidatus Peribacter riflensis]|uniref:Uncharacterized protein n=1 Tax=Candidatus Peribacter riflensis TaxID=1735162 RepID=A0A0S1SQP4_9BACT|nr:MAG: hypothetical protein PeribacterA2_0180 [Candidatus Peribacter riflensis]OGJ79352.1 MAG: hypothetical protein A2398_04230 [Candidatus Peribacteria bacterium RIFOXYB1_FULL_57_12]ALM10676.1 MAG: hypothetical protein PeribacterB2_0180 [Candidatus Peribacter riflensis]ALM11778.1 MAG: hypothetical protein PeribacterC2_0179 [Candidatus Peribacter riflensis]ALM12881.1 MAG: hypothetical protein PeribacterD1_0180 [Candidatus Peribacter riflensis]
MKVSAASLARAFVEIAKTIPEGDVGALGEAAAQMLIQHGLTRQSHAFLRLVEREWLKRDGAVPVRITTVSGHAGPLAKEIADTVEKALKRACHIEERADPALMGGVLLQVGDERYDATLRGALSVLAARLAEPVSVS